MKRLLLAAALAVLCAPGCGDGPICQSEILVVIQSPTGPVLGDSNATMPGVQTQVVVRSTLPEGAEVKLEVLDATQNPLSTTTQTADVDGNVTFDDVTLPDGAAFLRATGDAGECGHDSDTVPLDVAGTGCELAIRQTPLAVPFYAPLGVLDQALDTDPVADDFQGDVDVTARSGDSVELFVTDASGVESSAGTAIAAASGTASFTVTLGQGRVSVRAVCSSSGGAVTPSTSTSVFVDTIAPDCAMTNPAAGTTITPAMDADSTTSNGVQLTLRGHAGGGDVAGEATSFDVTVDGTTTTIAGTAFDAGGDTSAPATIAPASVPSSARIVLRGQDHALNTCSDDELYDVVYDGCSIAVTAPTSTVTHDADGDPSNGVQVDVTLAIDPACAGQTVTSSCGLDDPSGTVAVDGSATLRVHWCGTEPCEHAETCTFTVTSPAGIDTSVGAPIAFDDLAPPVGVAIVQPAVACGSQVTPSADIDGNLGNGVQVKVSVVSPLATTRTLQQTDAGGTQSFDATSDVTVTIAPGTTTFVGVAADAVGNSAQSAPCTLTLSDVAVDFSPPAADGTVGASDGTVSGSDLTFALCGTVSAAGASVDVAVDGGAAQPAVVTGTTWCVNETLAASPPSHTIVATATIGPLVGQNTLVLAVDLTPPPAIADLAVIADTRESLTATWTAPSDGGAAVARYLVRVSTTALTDANFDTTGTLLAAGTPHAPGQPESLRTAPRRTGTGFWLGVAAVDAAGNRAPAAIVGPVTPVFDQTAAILPPAPNGNALFGLTVARGKFNDDDLWDLAVAAPGADAGGHTGAGVVYVYFGTPTGIAATPDVEIDGTADFGSLGLSLAALRGSSASRDDLVIGEPYSNNQDGRVYIFDGATGFVPGVYVATDADVQIGTTAAASFFTGGTLGWSLAALDFDGDGRQDLAIGDAFGGNGAGGVAIVYGGTITGSTVLLSDTDASQIGGAVVHLIANPGTQSFAGFGNYLFDLGPTQGSADATDDLMATYADGIRQVYVLRGATARPTVAGVYPRAFTIGQDVRIDDASADATTEFGSAAASIADLDGDGARDLVIGAMREGADAGEVLLISGATLGTNGVASTADPGVTIGTIAAAPGDTLLGASIVNDATFRGADVDGDGAEDLVVSCDRGGIGTLLVWFGGAIPTGSVTSATANHVIAGPSTFTGTTPGFGGTMHAATWAGDVNGDGLDDIYFGDGLGNAGNGSFQVLWDDGT